MPNPRFLMDLWRIVLKEGPLVTRVWTQEDMEAMEQEVRVRRGDSDAAWLGGDANICLVCDCIHSNQGYEGLVLDHAILDRTKT
jgi:hypothetical protein